MKPNTSIIACLIVLVAAGACTFLDSSDERSGIAERPEELCVDYPYMVAIGQLQLNIYNAILAAAERSPLVGYTTESFETTRDSIEVQLGKAFVHERTICGDPPDSPALMSRESIKPLPMAERRRMLTLEGIGTCDDLWYAIERIVEVTRTPTGLPAEVIEAQSEARVAYVDFCEPGYQS